MEIITGGVTAAKGFKAAAAAAEIKYKGRTDMAMVYSEVPCVAAGTFTTNVVKAAPVKWDQNVVYNHPSAQAVICNSGIANACTGAEGYGYCKATADAASEILGIPADSVLVASTGVIGMQIPIDRIVNGVKAMAPKLDGSLEAGTEAAKAIMTTDTVKKEVAVQIEIGGKTVTVGGMCKGSGMIHPNMCTMLGFVTTDVNISKELLQEALSQDVKDTYNMVSVDGDTSTNDSFIVIATGQSGLQFNDAAQPGFDALCAAITGVAVDLAQAIIRDGEGATKFITIAVEGGKDREECKRVGYAIGHSPLVKTAFFASDPNLGRILAAIGYAEIDQLDVDNVRVWLGSEGEEVLVAENGGRADSYREEAGARIMKSAEITVRVDLGRGSASGKVYSCDFSYDYVKINADYRS